MMKIYILYLFLILYITPLLFIFKDTTEHFATNIKVKDVKQEESKEEQDDEEYILEKEGNGYSFEVNDKTIKIFPSNKTGKPNDIYFIYDSSPDSVVAEKFKFTDLNNQKYKFSSKKNNFGIKTSVNDKPIELNVNDFDKEYEFKKAATGNKKDDKKEKQVFNLIYFNSPIGNIVIEKEKGKTKNIKFKTSDKNIKDQLDYITAIFTSILIYDQLQDNSKINYEES